MSLAHVLLWKRYAARDRRHSIFRAFTTDRSYPRVSEATLKCPKGLREDGIEVEALDEGSAVPHANLIEDVGEVVLDSVLGDV